MSRTVPIATLALAAAALAGCRGTVLKPTPADALREQVQSLEIEVDRLSLQNRELEAALAEATAALAPGRLAERRPPGAALQAKALRPLESEPGGDLRGGDGRR